MTAVDVHAHHLPVALGERFAELSGRPYPLRHRPMLDGHLEDMDAAGIDRQLLGTGAIQPYWPDEAASATGAMAANDLYAQIVSSRPERFGALASVPLPHTDAAITEASRALDDLGFAGVGLGCSAAGKPLDLPEFDEFWAALNERSALVHLHPGVKNDLAIGVSEYPMLLGPVYGSPAETAVAVLRLVLAGVVRRFPRIRFVVAGVGGALLVNHGKLMHNLEFGVTHGADTDVDAIRADLAGLWFDSSGIDEVLLVALRRAVGVDRLVFGSDAPWGKATETRAALTALLGTDDAVGVLSRLDQVSA